MIVGAGEAGQMVINEINKNKGKLNRQVVALIDDNELLLGQEVCGKFVDGRVKDIPRLVKELMVDEIIFSKGHASPALYSALYLNKIITKKEIDGFRKVDGSLEGHPSIHTKGIKVATGSLGQGLSVGLRNGTSEKNYLKKREKYMLL